MKTILLCFAILSIPVVYAAAPFGSDSPPTTITGSPTVSGDLTVNGDAGFAGAVTISKDLTEKGDAGFAKNIEVDGFISVKPTGSGVGIQLPSGVCMEYDTNASLSVRGCNNGGGYFRYDNIGVMVTDTPLVDGNSYKAPHFAPAAANWKIIEAGTGTLSTGSLAVSFSPAFSATPVCVCSDTTATAAACNASSASTAGFTAKGTSSDTIAWHCIGDK